MLPINHWRKNAGLTLIEVLIALAIVGISLTAVIKATSQNIRGTRHLQEKTIATWLAQNVLNEALTGVLGLPSGGDPLEETRTVLNREWYVRANKEDTANSNIKRIAVEVYAREPKNSDDASLASLESYVHQAE